MSFIRKKKFKSGKIYAYEVTATWDSEKGQSRSVSKYLGAVDENGAIIPKDTNAKNNHKNHKNHKNHNNKQSERLIQDFGNGFLVGESIKKSDVYQPLANVFAKHPELLLLMAYRLCQPGPMYNCKLWLDGNILNNSKGSDELSSQNISRLMAYLGKESVQRSFFEQYLQQDKGGSKNIIIDATSLPNQINSAFNAWGYNDGGIDKQFRFHIVADQIRKRPLYYRNVPGNISDVSTIQATILELKALGVENSFALLDAGYCSQEIIEVLREHEIDFLMRLPAGRKIYKEMVLNHAKELENLDNAVKFNKRSLFVKAYPVEDLYGKKGYVYMVLDPNQKAKSLEKLIEERTSQKQEEHDDLKDSYAFSQAGIFMLISSKVIETTEVLGAYYTRQVVEQIFGFAKDDLELLPIRCHSDETIKGYLFLQFLLLIVYIEMRERLSGEFTVEQAITITRNLKCKVYADNIVIHEQTKAQKEIFKLSNIIVPNSIPGI